MIPCQALDDHGHTGAEKGADQRRFGKHADDIAHALAGKELKGVTDELDGVKEEAYAAEQLHRGKEGHAAFSKIEKRFS